MIAALREAVESRESRREVINKRQLTLGITDRQQAPHRRATDDNPVHIAAGAVHTDVVERREGLAPKKIDGAQIKYELFG